MPKQSVLCLALSRDVANQIVGRVKTSGFSSHDVSALFPEHATRDLAREKSKRWRRRKQPPIPQRAAWWAARRSGFASIGALAIPGVGPLIAAGPIIFALSVVAAGASGSGIAGALISMGIPEIEANHFEGKIKEGNILISVQAANSADVTLAKTIFREAGAHYIATTHEASLKDGSATERAAGPSEAASCPFEVPYGGTPP